MPSLHFYSQLLCRPNSRVCVCKGSVFPSGKKDVIEFIPILYMCVMTLLKHFVKKTLFKMDVFPALFTESHVLSILCSSPHLVYVCISGQPFTAPQRNTTSWLVNRLNQPKNLPFQVKKKKSQMEHNESFVPCGIKLNCQKPPAVFMGFDVYYRTSLLKN